MRVGNEREDAFIGVRLAGRRWRFRAIGGWWRRARRATLLRLRCDAVPEVHRRRGGNRRFVLDREVRLHVEVEDLRGEIRRELSHGRVEALHRRDVALARVLGGATLSLGKQFELSGEARYTFASAEMSRNDFSRYGPIDLGGFQAVIGIAARF